MDGGGGISSGSVVIVVVVVVVRSHCIENNTTDIIKTLNIIYQKWITNIDISNQNVKETDIEKYSRKKQNETLLFLL